MPKNNTGGKKHKRQKAADQGRSSSELVYADEENEDQYYGYVEKALGECRFYVRRIDKEIGAALYDSESPSIAHIPGRLRRGSANRINPGDYVLLEMRAGSCAEKPVAEILHKYTADHIRVLLRQNLVPKPEVVSMFLGSNNNTNVNKQNRDYNDEYRFQFDDSDPSIVIGAIDREGTTAKTDASSKDDTDIIVSSDSDALGKKINIEDI